MRARGSETAQPSVECGFNTMSEPSSGLGSKFGSRLGVSEAQRENLDLSAGVGECQLPSLETCFKPELISCEC